MAAPDSSLRILLVEDNPGDARLIEKQLGRVDTHELGGDFELVHVETLTDALETLESESSDIVLLDLGLPESTGIDTAKRVIDGYPSLPVVVLTGLQNRDLAIEAIRLGAQDYLNKEQHIDGPVLARAIRYAIERNAREQQLELRSERLEEFATVISHELRNPLNIIWGYIDLDRNGDRTGDHSRGTDDEAHLDRVERALDRMDTLVEKLLQMPKVNTSYEFETVDVGRLVADIWNTATTHEATLVVGEDLPAVVADSHRLRVLFEHLFQNAVQYGGPDVTVEVGALDGNEGFYVADDGPGLPDGEYATAFERGYSTGGADPGFGLTIVRSVVEDHGWKVRAVESESGGARFEVYDLSNTLSKLAHQPGVDGR